MNILTIAGTDPSGGAGIQADLQVMRDCGCHGLSVVSALVWQNTSGVLGWQATAPEVLEAQLLAVFEDIPVHAVKIGMLGTPENVQVVQRTLAGKSIPIVLDPVLASGDGLVPMAADLLDELRVLAAICTLVTPNLPEAERLLGSRLPVRDLAGALAGRLESSILLKVGHLGGTDDLVDILATQSDNACALAPHPRIADDVRGTGCQLSTAIACRLALGDDLLAAVEWSRSYLSRIFDRRQNIGRGRPVIVRT